MTKGFTLMEAMVAIFVIITGIVGVMTLITHTITSAQISKDRLTAAYLAQEGIEIVRNIRDTNWLEQYTESTNPWNEGLTGCSGDCEADYFCSTVEDPDPTNPASHYCLASYDSGHFLKINTNDLYNYATGIDTKFKRKITISDGPISNNSLNVEVEVFWEERGRTHQVTVKEILYNWR